MIICLVGWIATFIALLMVRSHYKDKADTADVLCYVEKKKHEHTRFLFYKAKRERNKEALELIQLRGFKNRFDKLLENSKKKNA